MATADQPEASYKIIESKLKTWKQGDCVLEEQWFVHRCNVEQPLTDASVEAAESGYDLAESAVQGFVVVTQTCDIVRSPTQRPFVQVAPLVLVEEPELHDIQRQRRPRYAFIPNLRDKALVADLDQIMTIEKSILADWERFSGCSDDEEIRAFSQVLARKSVRFAFPDDFTALTRKFQKRLKEKHQKQSDEGAALRALREIRVRAAPSWQSSDIELMFWFIRHEGEDTFHGTEWYKFLDSWLQLVPTSGRFTSIEGQVTTLENLSAKDYVESDLLDLDHLSVSE